MGFRNKGRPYGGKERYGIYIYIYIYYIYIYI
jgi:hypothetical protein